MKTPAIALRLLRSERHKARYRIFVLAGFAVLGPPLAGLHTPVFWIPYCFALLLYSLWALRLTAVFAEDRALGFVLCLLDIAMTLPLAFWGQGLGAKAAVGVACGAGLAASVAIFRRPATGGRSARTAAAAWDGRSVASLEDDPLGDSAQRVDRALPADSDAVGVILVRIARFNEMRAYYGGEAAARALAAVARRAARETGLRGEALELPSGRVVLVLPTPGAGSLGRLAEAVGRRVNERLVDGHRVDCYVGYARSPQDGTSVRELLRAADQTAAAPTALRTAEGYGGARTGRPRVAAG